MTEITKNAQKKVNDVVALVNPETIREGKRDEQR